MTSYRTSRDIEFAQTRQYPAFTLPKGTAVVLVKGADGLKGDLWAVRDHTLIVKLTGNSHDPKYRWTWVPEDAVEPAD